MADVDAETQTAAHESTPLLPSDRVYLHRLRQSRDFIACHIVKIHGEDSWVWLVRRQLQRFLASKWGHYFVILLVSADISCIFADFLVSLHICEHAGDKDFNLHAWRTANDVLGFVSLAFSCLFMAELLGSIFAFGFDYFRSKFHIFDALVIIAAFIIDVLLRGPLEEAGSLVVVFRLWRIFKIIEEFSTGAADELEELQERIEALEREKDEVVKENQQLRYRTGYAAEGDTTGGTNGHNGGGFGQ
ncbi:hypothetical protein A1O1_08140 [Capronia coronata CBS 617.96]|uniref:Voltage-gated hydrogen channel 1 n=1 Tax=Capronia coronata CBS 617.96 TaxID=1182541 RepID=W9XYM2_9EURO|nr:uncharacterized protein A1O1_08140 [Capronia coronata CBS 617.96]EXJ82071.1 hypothetical protein A1O1_08140 [Capronia coronata CBS 617.96]